MDCNGQDEGEELALCRKNLSKEAAKDVFVLTYDRMRRYEGVWHMERRLLFPSYIFLDSEDEILLEAEIKKILCGKYGITRTAQGLTRIDPDAEKFLKCLYRSGHHLKMSRGVIQDGIPRITAGPLRGMEQRICKIDRHKKLARLTMHLGQMCDGLHNRQEFGYITAGLEIMKKGI